MSTKQNRFWHLAGNVLLSAASVLLAYGVVGGLLLVYGPAIAWRPINKFPTAATLAWQPSGPKRSDDPYIAVLGDSYAVGIGDWNAGRRSRHDPYYSGDVISERLGLPVLSFGKNGASSVEALVTNPGRIMNADSCFLLDSPAQPQSLVVYVYEGNDFNDNLLDFEDIATSDISKRGIADFIEQESKSARDVPCYVYISKLAVNLISGYVRGLFTRDETLSGTTGQAVQQAGRTGYIANRLQGPALELDEPALASSFEVLRRSLDHLMLRFPRIPVLIVDVPSVLTPYRLLADKVTTATYHGGKSVWETGSVRSRSDALCARLQALAKSKGALFLDARPILAKAAEQRMIHGPLDWKHLNQAGQIALGTAVADALKGGSHDTGCAKLASSSTNVE